MTTYLTSPVIKDGAVKLKKYDGTPQRQWERLTAHALLVVSTLAIVLGLYFLATANLFLTEQPTGPAPTQPQPVQVEKPSNLVNA